MIVMIDYDAGNTCSVMNALDRLDADYILTDDRKSIESADKVIFPGVGHAGAAMDALKRKGLEDTIRKLNQPVLGICVGMQLLAERSEEGDTLCLGIVPGCVKKFIPSDGINVPHMGWNQLIIDKEDYIFDDINSEEYFYFVHSYYMPDSESTIASCDYGMKFSAAVRHNNFRGIQFHAEKSVTKGAVLIENFLKERN